MLKTKQANLAYRIGERQPEYAELRRELHGHPELGFEEWRTSERVVAHLKSFGIDVISGIGGTGVVATIRRGRAKAAIGLRADLDALPMQELNEFKHRSRIDNCFHGCGHDGHTTMLLAAAELLREHAQFNGTVHLIFQPAEEGLGGAQAMIEDGLFERFPCDAIFGMHNLPRLPVGHFAVRAGPFMAAADSFRIILRGTGGHAALPHTTADPVVAAAHIVTALQTLVSRNTDPLHAAVFSVGQIQAGEAHNVIPDTVQIKGSARFLDAKDQAKLSKQFKELVCHIAAGFGVTVDTFDYTNTFPVLVNTEMATRQAIRAAAAVVGEDNLATMAEPFMGSEDFASMLQRVPGCYVFIGNGGGDSACMIHNPHYDFNDEIISIGASYWVKLVEEVMPKH